MGLSVFPVPTAASGLTVGRFPARSNAAFNIPAGLTLQHTVTSTTTFTAGQLPAQVWAVIVGGGGAGGSNGSTSANGGGGGGGVVIGWVDIPSAGTTATIGAGGATANSNGNRGGTTSFARVQAGGGGGGCGNGNGTLSTGFAVPLQGEGLPGYGGDGSGGTLYTTSNATNVYPNGAPFASNLGNFIVGTSGGTSSLWLNTNIINSRQHNYSGGGAGAWQTSGFGTTGGDGFTAGGGASTGNGGSSFRDGGITATFTGGTSQVGGGSGGGAGFLANGSNANNTTGGAGGSGGGGGGAGFGNQQSGAGGAGCVLIYF